MHHIIRPAMFPRLPTCLPALPCLPLPAADDIDTSKMQAKLEFVPIEQLAAFVDKKVRGGEGHS